VGTNRKKKPTFCYTGIETKTNTPSKQELIAKCNELQQRLDKIVLNITSGLDPLSSDRQAQLEEAIALCENLKNLEPAVAALKQ